MLIEDTGVQIGSGQASQTDTTMSRPNPSTLNDRPATFGSLKETTKAGKMVDKGSPWVEISLSQITLPQLEMEVALLRAEIYPGFV